MNILPYDGTATERRKLRQEIRNVLGVSHQGPPDLRQLFRAIRLLDRLVKLSTAGQYELRLLRKADSTVIEGEHAFSEVRRLEQS